MKASLSFETSGIYCRATNYHAPVDSIRQIFAVPEFFVSEITAWFCIKSSNGRQGKTFKWKSEYIFSKGLMDLIMFYHFY
jgi:hypothetical protein